MAVIRNYKTRIKELIQKLYEPGDITSYDVKMTTEGVYNNLCSILPSTAFDQYDVLEALEELNFFPGYETKKETIEDEKGNKTEKIYDDLTYFWYLKKLS